MREHDREQVLVLFTLEPVTTYLPRAAIAVARLAGGVGVVARHRDVEHTVGTSAPHVLRVEIEGGVLEVLSEEPLEGDAERAARFGAALLSRGLSLSVILADQEAQIDEKLSTTTLGPRERELARLVAAGANTKEIATKMALTEASVRTYVKRILSKVGVRSRLSLVAWLNET